MMSLLVSVVALPLLFPLPLRAQAEYECSDVLKRAAEINRFGEMPPVAKVLTMEGMDRENNELVDAYSEFKRQHRMPIDDKALTENQKEQLKPFQSAMKKLKAPLLESSWAKVHGWDRIVELGYAEGNSARLYLIKNRIAAFSFHQSGEQVTYGLAPNDCVINYVYIGSALNGGISQLKGVSKATCARRSVWSEWRDQLPDGKRRYDEVCRLVGGYMTGPSCECPGAIGDWNPYMKDCGRRLPEKVVSDELESTKAVLYDVTRANLGVLESLCQENAGLFNAPDKALSAAMPAPSVKAKRKR